MEEAETIRREQTPQVMALPPEQREKAFQEMETLANGRIPDQLASRVVPMQAVAHVWDCLWDLDSERPVSSMPVGLGGSIPVREAIPWGKVEEWMDRRGITDPWDRSELRRFLRPLDAEYRRHQAEAFTKADEDG